MSETHNSSLGGGDGSDLLIQSPIHQMESQRSRRHKAAWAGLSLLMIASVLALHQNGLNLSVSVLPTKQAPAFDGTVYPIEKAPNWVKLKSEEYKYNYEQIPSEKLIEAPVYNPANLERTIDTLKWGNSADDAIRNQKITYSVPYMGSYRLNGKEMDGSHLAIDIKVPRNTPVRAIANGVVTKISQATSGFGKHLVIQHIDVPSLENPSTKTTYFSSYSHLGTILISEGDVVLRGQNVALSGDTGFATTPHIHFQMDRVEAPWHPFWPFTFQEQSAAGLDFVGAINAGLGKDKGLQYTINPMTFVQKYLTGAPVAPSESAVPVTPPPAPVVEPPVVTPVAAEPAPTPIPAPAKVVTFTFSQKTSYQLGEEIRITISAKDEQGNPATSLDNAALLLLSGDVGIISKSDINSSDLSSGQMAIVVQSPKVGQGQLTVLYNGVQTKSESFTIVNPAPSVVVAPPAASPEVIQNRPSLFADVGGSTSFYDAIKYLKNKNIFSGYKDGTFKPDQVISRTEVLKVALVSANRPLLPLQGALSYQDLDAKAWYIPYIATAQLNGITQGYIGGYFKPNQNVTRAEFLKILLLATPVSIEPTVNDAPYPDVSKDEWYAVFAQFGKQKNILPKASDGFRPNEEITRGEVAEIIYRLMLIVKTGSTSYTAGLTSN